MECIVGGKGVKIEQRQLNRIVHSWRKGCLNRTETVMEPMACNTVNRYIVNKQFWEHISEEIIVE